jgi:glycosyltransferase involved in cell wall biosynthesis
VRVIQRKNIGEFILLSVLFENQANFAVTQAPKNPEEIKQYKKWVSFCQEQQIHIIFEAGNKCNFEELLIASDFCITTSYKEGFGMVYLEPWLANTPVVGRNIDFITKDFIADGFEFPKLYNQIQIPGYESDFKDFDLNKQQQIITDILKNKIDKNLMLNQNKKLLSLFDKVKPTVFAKNISLIKNNYSLEGYGIKLQNRYKKIPG